MARGIVVVVAIGLILAYTNIYDVLKPEIEPAVDTAKDAISKVDGDDVIEKAEEITYKIKDVTDQIKVNNPLEPKE